MAFLGSEWPFGALCQKKKTKKQKRKNPKINRKKKG